MQAPKDGDARIDLGRYAGTYGGYKDGEDPATCQDRGEPRETFATRNRTEAGNVKGLTDAFTRGFVKGLHPLALSDVRVDSSINSDVTTYRIGAAMVAVSGLDLIKATDVETLGVLKGEALRLLVDGGVESPRPTHVVVDPAETVPVPVVLAWTGGGAVEGSYGVVTLGIEGVAVRYVPERKRGPSDITDFDHWYASEYTRVYERHIRTLQDRINAFDGGLSEVLHALAGEASMCWDERPKGVFDSSRAIEAVERAIGRLRPILRDV